MTTKQILFSALVLGFTGSITLGMNSDDLMKEYKENLDKLTKDSQRENEICVSMWGANAITIEPTNKNTHIISTNGLAGCTATALHVKYSDGTQYAAITHFPPVSIEQQLYEIKKQQNQAFKNQNSTKKIETINSFTVVPGEWIKEDNKYSIVPIDKRPCDLLNENYLSLAPKDTKQIFNKHCIAYDMQQRNKRTSAQKPTKDIQVNLSSTETSSIAIDINNMYYKNNLS